MKDSFRRILIIMILFTFCTGCVKFDYNMNIHNDKSMNIGVSITADKQIIKTDILGKTEKKVLKENGYIIKKYEDKKYEGYNISYRLKNIDKVSTKNNTTFSITSIKDKKISDMFKIKKHWFYNEYSASFIFDSTDISIPTMTDDLDKDKMEYLCDDGSVIEILRNEEINREDCHKAFDYEIENAKSEKTLSVEELEKKNEKGLNLKFNVNLDSSAIKSNATKSENNKKKLTWNLKKQGITEINFKFQLLNRFHIFIICISFIMIVAGIVLCTKKFKNNSKNRKERKNEKIKKNIKK